MQARRLKPVQRPEGTEPPFSRSKLIDRGRQIRGGEIRPHDVAKHDFGVGVFPEQKIAEPLLSACSNQKVNVGPEARRVSRPRQRTGKRFSGRPRSRSELPGGFDDRVACGVIDGDPQVQLARRASLGLGLVNGIDQAGREPVPPPDDVDTDALLRAMRCLGSQVSFEELQQLVHFAPRPLPVVRRECVEGQCGDTKPRRRLHGAPNRVCAGPVSGGTAAYPAGSPSVRFRP